MSYEKEKTSNDESHSLSFGSREGVGCHSINFELNFKISIFGEWDNRQLCYMLNSIVLHEYTLELKTSLL